MTDAVERSSDYRHFTTITTRWMDNDVYGHVNNVTFYSYFDTAANEYLIEHGGLDVASGPVIGVVAESHCRYRAPAAYPEKLRIGLRVDRLGNRSVTYGLAVFRSTGDEAIASGSFVHVFVDRGTRRPVAIPDRIRGALERILAAGA